MNFIQNFSSTYITVLLILLCFPHIKTKPQKRIIPRDAKIYVAGHTGLVGSAMMRALHAAEYTNVLVRTSTELDLRNQCAVQEFFRIEQPEYVILAAAKVGGILANKTYGAEFIYDNLMIATNVIQASFLYGVKKLINLGSSCIYPKLAPQPISEDSLLSGPLEQTNEPYAIAKIAAIKLCRYYNEQYGTNFISMMPSNLYGPNDNFNLEKSHVLPALMRKIHLARLLEQDDFEAITHDLKTYRLGYGLDEKINYADPLSIIELLQTVGISKNEVKVWGTGNPLREFLHVDDLASAVMFLFQNYDARDIGECLNTGFGEDIALKDLAALIKECIGFNGSLSFDAKKPDGTPKKLLDVSRLNALGWQARIHLSDGLKSFYGWYNDHLWSHK